MKELTTAISESREGKINWEIIAKRPVIIETIIDLGYGFQLTQGAIVVHWDDCSSSTRLHMTGT